jgi:anti-sigma B factor antagonist
LPELELVPVVDGTTARVTVRGEIDVATAPQLREMLHDLIQGGASQIVLDCRDLGFLDSSGIGLLVAARKRLGAGELVIESPPPHVRKVLELTGVASELSLRP